MANNFFYQEIGRNENSCNSPRQRIEYIDALRGFTMLLVVMTHCSGFCLQSMDGSFNSFMVQFRMPLFFFISGFVFYKKTIWNRFSMAAFLKKKCSVQILTPSLFLVIYTYIYQYPIKEMFFDYYKLGYWFTYTLFIYFVFYICIKSFCTWIKLKEYISGCILAAVGGYLYFVEPIFGLPVNREIANLLLMSQWAYSIFFVAGTFARKYFDSFQIFLDNQYYMLIIVSLYFLLNIFHEYFCGINCVIVDCILRFCGLFIVFAFFRKYSSVFTKEKYLGRCLQYVGRRTLDIYLLHYFFLPWALSDSFTFFEKNKIPSIEILVSLFLSSIVISICLIISNIYRLSPWVEQKMFGGRNKI